MAYAPGIEREIETLPDPSEIETLSDLEAANRLIEEPPTEYVTFRSGGSVSSSSESSGDETVPLRIGGVAYPCSECRALYLEEQPRDVHQTSCSPDRR